MKIENREQRLLVELALAAIWMITGLLEARKKPSRRFISHVLGLAPEETLRVRVGKVNPTDDGHVFQVRLFDAVGKLLAVSGERPLAAGKTQFLHVKRDASRVCEGKQGSIQV